MSLVSSLYLSGIFTSRYLPQLLGCSNTYPRLGISLISSLYLYMISSPKKLVIHDMTVIILKVTINFNNCYPFRSTWVHSRFLMGIVLLYLYFYVSFCPFSFGHCVFCPFPNYGFWLPLWYLQTLLIRKVFKYQRGNSN
jgi:hypothetical protein